MSDLIKREDAIDAIGADIDEIDALDPSAGIKKACIRRAIWKVMGVPSADRPQGEWIEVRAFDAFGGDEATWMAHGNPTAFHYCSECKEQARIDEFGEEILSNFCPNCGARMKGADDGSR